MKKYDVRYFSTILLCMVALFSCDTRKSYKYVELVQEESVFGGTTSKDKEAKQIKAENDTLAYLEAYENFCISAKVTKDMQSSLGKVYSIPKNFKLYNSKGINIKDEVSFASKSTKEKEIEERIFSLENSIQKAVEKTKIEKAASFKQSSTIDSAKIKELIKYFRQEKDEYSNNHKIWYQPKSAPQYTNANGIYCYFNTENGVPGSLRFRLQYYADDWLFFSSVRFSIDGNAYEYIPMKTETDNGDGGYIWEWFDEALSDTDKELIYALSNAKNAKMKLNGRQYYKEKGISQQQISSIKKTLDLYKAMGGQY